MTLSKDVPTFFAIALREFTERLFKKINLDLAEEKDRAIFVVHPGGPKIIALSEHVLHLAPEQTSWSRAILREHGNMSSATLPHIWQKILEDPKIPDGSLIASLGAGPGLTISGALFRKRI
jgi:predicted naringenin-chalcone synthase